MRQPAKLGMAMFLLNEAVFFFMLIAAFVYFRSAGVPAAAANLNLPMSAIYTACLLASSFTMWRSVASGARAWLAGTLVLGAIFLFGQSLEYAHLLRRHVTISQNIFGATFFTLTGIHGLHVLVGLLLLAGLFALGGAAFRPAHRMAVETIALYWYFVDAVWLAIFSIVYLWSFL